MNALSFRESVTSAIRYWECGRIAYNATLLVVVGGIFVFYWPHSADAISFDMAQGFFALAVLANVAYCAAYPVDLLVQASGYRSKWLRVRWMMLVVGTIFASVVAQFMARTMVGTSAA